MEKVEVAITHTSIVKPASSSPQASLFLSAIDVLIRDLTYNRRVLFYERPASASGEDEYALFISTLQRSLSQALTHFYPLAGRLAVVDGRLTVACNDAGVEFVEALIHGACFTELRSSNFDMRPYFVHLTRWASYSSQLHEGSAPLFSVQVTHFPCGGIALGIAHSHVLADGFSLWHFMNSWAECARGEPISLYPSHDRTLLKVENPSKEIARFDLLNLECHEVEHKEQGVKQRAFSFTKEMVTRLKRWTNNEFSSYEVLCAHIWKKVSSARGHARNVEIGFCNVVNMRARINPPLPPGYFGNVLYWCMATTSMGELQDEDLTTTASRIRAAINSCSNVGFLQLLHLLELHGKDEVITKIILNGVRIRVSSSPKFPMLCCNFGWGKPLGVRSSVVEENGKVVLYSGPSGLGSIDVCMSLTSHVMQQLESDPSFLINI